MPGPSRDRRHATARTSAARGIAVTAAIGAAVAACVGTGVPATAAVGRTTQVITVRTYGSYATVTARQESGDGWKTVIGTTAARIGVNGVVAGADREQGSGTTPTGTYPITHGFGVGADPGTAMPYHRVTGQDWWVEDPTSAYYNRMRTAAQGGFHLTTSGPNGSEHLIDHPTAYHSALVIDFNTAPAVKGRGAGIFLHDLGPTAGPTAGCVAVPAGVMTRIMKWIDPADHPVITIR